MKKIKALLILFCFIVQVQALGEGMISSGGGDTVALDFVQVAKQVHVMLEKNYPASFPKIDLTLLASVIQDTKVESTEEQLMLNGRVVDAINFPGQKKIIVSRQGWQLFSLFEQKVRIVFHEYLGVLGIDDTNYHLSASREIQILCQRQRELDNELLYAAGKDTCEKVKELLDPGANPNARNEYWETPLMHASANRSNAPCITRLLIERGANVNAVSRNGSTALINTAWNTTRSYYNQGDLKIVLEMLLKAGAVVNHQTTEFKNFALFTILGRVLGRGERKEGERRIKEFALLLIEYGADVTLSTIDAVTPLHRAADNSGDGRIMFDLIQTLLLKGADPNAVEVRNSREYYSPHYDGATPLMVAVKSLSADNERFIQLFLDHGASVNARDWNGRSVLYWAMERRFPKIIKLLIDAGASN